MFNSNTIVHGMYATFRQFLNYISNIRGHEDREVEVWLCGEKESLNCSKAEEIFEKEILKRYWFTYRRGFSFRCKNGKEISTDAGWGCMLRCGQMILAEAIRRMGLISDDTKMIALFDDCEACRFSINNILQEREMDLSVESRVDEWFGPNMISQILKRLCSDGAFLYVHVAMDNTIVLDKFVNLQRKQTSLSKPLLLLIPLMVGISEFDKRRSATLKRLLRNDCSVGFIGGRPKHALFFFGLWGTDNLLYLDPHTLQQCTFGNGEKRNETFHCRDCSYISFEKLDPSLALGFVCDNVQSFNQLIRELSTIIQEDALHKEIGEPTSIYPLFEIVQRQQEFDGSVDCDDILMTF
ncbi:hypothetical protein ACOME3_007133 [Neoechinorhynchus agilis]